MRGLEFITVHVIFKLRYNQTYQMIHLLLLSFGLRRLYVDFFRFSSLNLHFYQSQFQLNKKNFLIPVGKFWNTVFPHIVSAETILFWLWPYVLWPLITVHKCAETIQGRKLIKGGNYMRKYGKYLLIFILC